MTIEQAKQQVIAAGKRLVEANLIVRTWGNVSSRLDQDRFLITPSGRNYLTLTPAEIVTVNISDLSYTGKVKPSSERRIHAAVYEHFPEINFVIHTHQEQASIIAASGLDSLPLGEANPLLGREVLCAPYALPGTGALQRRVTQTLLRAEGKAVLMQRHGALCLGRCHEEAFQVAAELERVCGEFIEQRFDWGAEVRQSQLPVYPKSRRITGGFSVIDRRGRETEIQLSADAEDECAEIAAYRAIYTRYSQINWVLFDSGPELVEFSGLGLSLRPLLDDFAQIVGTSVKSVTCEPRRIAAALKRSAAVFVQGLGAVCCGKTKEDARAVAIVTKKASKAYLMAALLNRPRPINPLEALLMRFIYQKTYSQLAEKKS
ncbi:MAG TPA: class II aldolase/adducin family protein [Firmicutes bacterium]|nr:class II aldolase/adducin family protein [Bacillota bacterium]